MHFVPFHRLSSLIARLASSELKSAPDTMWLVWEAGNWKPASPYQDGTAPRTPGKDEVQTADALIFELVPPAGTARFVVGRSRTCEVLINDATVSRSHITLTHSPRGWTVGLAPGGKAASLDGNALGSTPVELHSGGRMELGSAQLTFLDGQALGTRLRQEATRKKKR